MKESYQEKYIEVDAGTYLLKKSLKPLSQVEALVLDIDGVILDVTQSFREVISKTVQYFFKQVLKSEGEERLISPRETNLFKSAGGFNNDWELTCGVVLFYLAKAEVFETRNLGVLRFQGEDLEHFTYEVRRRGGGLSSLEKVVFESGNLDETGKATVRGLWNKNLIKQIFQEYYGGEDHCERLYGFQPQYIKESGFLNQERVLLDKKNLEFFLPQVAILTGRNKEETEIALEKSHLNEVIPWESILYDDGKSPRKPSPETLRFLIKNWKIKAGVYIGDVFDDLKTVINFNENCLEKGWEERFLAAVVTKGKSQREWYMRQEVDLVGLDVNKILQTIIKARRKGYAETYL